jgi:UPF0755 protein
MRPGGRSSRPATARRSSRRPPAGSHPPKSNASRLAIAAILLSIGALYFTLVVGYGNSRGPGAGRDVDLDLPRGANAQEIAQRLDAAGLVRRPSLFALYLRATGATSEVRPGRHLLSDDLSPRALVRRMQRTDKQEKAKVAIPEGFTRFDIARRLQAARICSARAFLDATVDGALLGELKINAASAEGYLFPATYELPLDTEPSQVVTRMVTEFGKRYERLTRDNAQGTENLRQRLSWGPAEIVILASIVEKEAAVDEERPIIASVFLNRLIDPSFTPKRLQSDPTSAYGCLAMPERISSCRSYSGRVTPEMNADDTNPYTTYRHEGLPPGPIANPGEKSLQAVLVPAETRHLYFVARGGGHHTFSDNYAQHNEAIRRHHGSP